MSAALIRCHPIDQWNGTRRTSHDRSPYDAGPDRIRTEMDRFDHWWDNLRAIGLTLQRLRLVEQTGVARSGEQYRGWAALGPGESVALGAGTRPAMTREAAAELLSEHAIESPSSGRSVVSVGDLLSTSPEHAAWALRQAYRLGSRRYHPDAGASADPALFARLTEARKVLDPKS